MKQKSSLILAGILLLVGILGSVFMIRKPDTNIVEIVQDGEVLYRLDLSRTEDQTIEVEYEERVNRIQIQGHQIHMLEADCPDHTCINRGWLDSSVPIVCLPNHLVIQFVDTSEDMDVIAQ